MNPLSRLSIGKKLTLLVTGLLLLAVTLMSLGLFQATKRAAVALASSRLDGVSKDLAGLLTQNVPRSLDSSFILGHDPRVVAAFAHPAAMVVPDTLKRQVRAQTVGVVLRDRSLAHRVTFGNAGPPLSDSIVRAMADTAARGRGAAIGALTTMNDTVYYPLFILAGSKSEPLGYIVLWSRVSGAPSAAAQLRALVGTGAGLFIGNRTADVWTDLVGPVTGLPAAVAARRGAAEYDRPGAGHMLARTRDLPGTPWVVSVEFPQSVVMAPVKSFLVEELLIGGLLVALGAVLAWLMSRRITGPIVDLTHAAERLAAGDLHARVPVNRQDELGRLATAFDTMADQVEASTERQRGLNVELERRVKARTAELEDANRELEAFSYSVSHDLRAPLRAIDGFSRLVVEDHASSVSPEGRRLLDVIRANTRRMGTLIDDLLQFSKLGRQSLTKGPVDLTALAESVATDVGAAQASRPDIRVLPQGSIYGDRALLRHVLENLISNAVKFSRNQKDAVVEVGTRPGLGERIFYVRDNGVGFDPRYADKLFGVFQRLHRSDEFEGTGVGLAIVQRIVQRHGGRVWAEGTPGGGATFFFSLPNEEAAA